MFSKKEIEQSEGTSYISVPLEEQGNEFLNRFQDGKSPVLSFL